LVTEKIPQQQQSHHVIKYFDFHHYEQENNNIPIFQSKSKNPSNFALSEQIQHKTENPEISFHFLIFSATKQTHKHHNHQ
jgi:hypothetical protein